MVQLGLLHTQEALWDLEKLLSILIVMIRKVNRLKEKEIKKVLKHRKPFFSYNLVANYCTNWLPYSRFAIFLSWKNCKTSISRNFFRRRFYDESSNYVSKWWMDIVLMPKKWKVFDKKTPECIVEFRKDLKFIYKNIFDNKLQWAG